MKTKPLNISKKIFIGFMILGVLSGGVSCVKKATPEIKNPVSLPGSFSKTGESTMPKKWWKTLNDSQLDDLVEAALRDNFNLKSTWARLEQARAIAKKAGADILPKIDLSGGYAKTTSESTERGRVRSDEPSLGLSASYELDLWGRIRATRNAAATDVLSSRQDLYAAAITLSGDIAETWYKLVEQRKQLQLLNSQMKINEEYLELVSLRFRRGVSSSANVLQQRQLLESIKGEKIQIETAITMLKHQLTVLLGHVPGSYYIPESEKLPDLLALPNTGLPAELLNRRPDVRSAFLKVEAANLRIAAAIADQYPRISLTARAEGSGTGVHNLFQNWLATLAANIAVPLLDRRRLTAEIARSKAASLEALNNFGQKTLMALKEVEDALQQEAQQVLSLKNLASQLQISKNIIEQMQEDYLKGQGDFLQLLNMRYNHMKLERTVLKSNRELLQFRIYLYRALGGGWDLQTPKEIIDLRAKKNRKGK